MFANYICPRCFSKEGVLNNALRYSRPQSLNHRSRSQDIARLFSQHARRADTLKTEPYTTPLQNDVKNIRESVEKGKESVLDVLEARGFIHDIAGARIGLDDLLKKTSPGVYVGIDPTAPSLHVGHLLPLMALLWMSLSGYPTFPLVGGFTARIGDPSGRTTARDLQSSTTIADNSARIVNQLEKLWKLFGKYAHSHKQYGAGQNAVKNNAEWGPALTLEDFLRTIGTGVRLGTMLSRDTVKIRLAKGGGMSFAEFTYPLLQSYDFVHLYRTFDVQLQIGGSDQYGNIVAGIDAINHYQATAPSVPGEKKKDAKDPLSTPYGLTVPLLTTASGAKFGKSAGNAIWLDSEKTSIFDLYGFMLSTADADVERFLKLFTLVPLHQIAQAMEFHAKDPSARHPQHLLAHELVSLVHGATAADRARSQHAQLFGRRGLLDTKTTTGDSEASSASLSLVPDLTLPRSHVLGHSFVHVIVLAKLTDTRSMAQNAIEAKGIYLGASGQTRLVFSRRVEDRKEVVREQDLVEGRWLVLRKGKKDVGIVEVVDDEGWEEKD